MIKTRSVSVVLSILVFAGTVQTTWGQAQDESVTDARAFIELLVNKKFASAVEQFDNTMKTALPETKLAETWTSVQAQVGPFKQAGAARSEKAW